MIFPGLGKRGGRRFQIQNESVDGWRIGGHDVRHSTRGDRRFSEDIKRVQTLIESGELLLRVEEKVGRLE